MSRELDVVIWGATGFTGRLVAEYLCQRYGVGGEVKWAIAGRNAGKLEALRDDLARDEPSAAALPVILGDSFDQGALRALAARTRVVCSTVGPYAEYGSPLVAACVQEGAHYCDLTGESHWIREMVDAHHQEAQEAGVRIVHCCGFDSIPSDMGTFFLQEQARQEHGAPMREVTFYMGKTRGGFSGGTVASLFGVAKAAKASKEVRRVLLDPYALNPEGERQGPDGYDPRGVDWSQEVGGWVAPFLMGPINTRIVRRSNALRGYAYGQDFRYQEWMSLPPGPRGWLMGQAVQLGIGALLVAATVEPLGNLLLGRVLPAPGEGPTQEERESGYFQGRIIGTGPDADGNPARVEVRFRGERDPGYGATSRMLAEAALCLAQDGDALPEVAGVLTPSVAMGAALLPRLESVGVTFKRA
jgi:short subunit dehydrogenase-like uncharacterized protein